MYVYVYVYARIDFKSTKLVGDIIVERQPTLLGQLIRPSPLETIRKIAFDVNLKRSHQYYERTGQPRLIWVDDNLQRAHQLFGDPSSPVFDQSNPNHVSKLIEAANKDDF